MANSKCAFASESASLDYIEQQTAMDIRYPAGTKAKSLSAYKKLSHYEFVPFNSRLKAHLLEILLGTFSK